MLSFLKKLKNINMFMVIIVVASIIVFFVTISIRQKKLENTLNNIIQAGSQEPK